MTGMADGGGLGLRPRRVARPVPPDGAARFPPLGLAVHQKEGGPLEVAWGGGGLAPPSANRAHASRL